jgi:hypothetical protein
MSDKSVYSNPKYYEFAFSFRNIPKEVDVFEKSIALYSRIPVKEIFEIGCGNSLSIRHTYQKLFRSLHGRISRPKAIYSDYPYFSGLIPRIPI